MADLLLHFHSQKVQILFVAVELARGFLPLVYHQSYPVVLVCVLVLLQHIVEEVYVSLELRYWVSCVVVVSKT